MKVNVIHPEELSFNHVQSFADQGETIKRSPHIGNVNRQELALLIGLDQMGTLIEVELVDTIHGHDKYAQPRKLLGSTFDINLASNNHTKNMVVGACKVSEAGAQEAHKHGKAVAAGMGIAELHQDALVACFGENVRIQRSSELFSSLGCQALEFVAHISEEIVDRPLRSVDASGKIQVHNEPAINSVFGVGEARNEGVLIPLEAMMAVEMLIAMQSKPGEDTAITHIGGPDMIVYTKDQALMAKSEIIAEKTACELGLLQNVTIDYIVPHMQKITEHRDFPELTQLEGVVSQHDLVKL